MAPPDARQARSTISNLPRNPWPARSHFPGIEDDAVAVEDQLVIAPDLVDVDQRLAELLHLRRTVPGGTHACRPRTGWRCVDQNLRPGGVQIGDGILMIEPAGDQLFIVPQILADAQAADLVADRDRFARSSRGPGSKYRLSSNTS
jgi:hypothetical protein